MKTFDIFKKDFYLDNGKYSEDLLSPYNIRVLKTDNIDGRQWNNNTNLPNIIK